MDSMSSMFQNVGSAVQTAADAVRTDVREFFVGEDVETRTRRNAHGSPYIRRDY